MSNEIQVTAIDVAGDAFLDVLKERVANGDTDVVFTKDQLHEIGFQLIVDFEHWDWEAFGILLQEELSIGGKLPIWNIERNDQGFQSFRVHEDMNSS